MLSIFSQFLLSMFLPHHTHPPTLVSACSILAGASIILLKTEAPASPNELLCLFSHTSVCWSPRSNISFIWTTVAILQSVFMFLITSFLIHPVLPCHQPALKAMVCRFPLQNFYMVRHQIQNEIQSPQPLIQSLLQYRLSLLNHLPLDTH